MTPELLIEGICASAAPNKALLKMVLSKYVVNIVECSRFEEEDDLLRISWLYLNDRLYVVCVYSKIIQKPVRPNLQIYWNILQIYQQTFIMMPA